MGGLWSGSGSAPPTSSQLTSRRVTGQQLTHTHLHTHTHTHLHTHSHLHTHALPLRPHCSVRPPASEMTIAIVAVHEEASPPPPPHRLIVTCCFNDSWRLYHSRLHLSSPFASFKQQTKFYFPSQKKIIYPKWSSGSEYSGNQLLGGFVFKLKSCWGIMYIMKCEREVKLVLIQSNIPGPALLSTLPARGHYYRLYCRFLSCQLDINT